MRILVIGASQGTGALAVRSALDKGYEATAFARTPEKLQLQHERLRKITGDFHRRDAIDAAMPGHDAVIVTASATSLGAFKDNPHYFSQGTGYVIDAMKKTGARRLVVLSALGVAESRPLLNPIVRIAFADFVLRPAFDDHARQEAQVRASGLDWVIARPGRLTNGPARHKSTKKIALDPVPFSISRADLAEFLVDACLSPSWVGHAVQLGG
jgi:uncharacterized protein YbjT (DUF2867 family)